MNTIFVRESVSLPNDSRVIELQVQPRDGVCVVLDNLHWPGNGRVVATLQWDELADAEFLADRFDTEAVRTFKVLMGMLGRLYANRHIYEALT